MVQRLAESTNTYTGMTDYQLFNSLAEFAQDMDWMDYVDDSLETPDEMWDYFVEQTEQQFLEDEETRSLLYDSITDEGFGAYAKDPEFLAIWAELEARYPV